MNSLGLFGLYRKVAKYRKMQFFSSSLTFPYLVYEYLSGDDTNNVCYLLADMETHSSDKFYLICATFRFYSD